MRCLVMPAFEFYINCVIPYYSVLALFGQNYALEVYPCWNVYENIFLSLMCRITWKSCNLCSHSLWGRFLVGFELVLSMNNTSQCSTSHRKISWVHNLPSTWYCQAEAGVSLLVICIFLRVDEVMPGLLKNQFILLKLDCLPFSYSS